MKFFAKIFVLIGSLITISPLLLPFLGFLFQVYCWDSPAQYCDDVPNKMFDIASDFRLVFVGIAVTSVGVVRLWLDRQKQETLKSESPTDNYKKSSGRLLFYTGLFSLVALVGVGFGAVTLVNNSQSELMLWLSANKFVDGLMFVMFITLPLFILLSLIAMITGLVIGIRDIYSKN